jgi:hypothetical protein
VHGGGGPQQPSVSYGAGEGSRGEARQPTSASPATARTWPAARSSSLIDDTWLYGGTDADLAKSIRDGRRTR